MSSFMLLFISLYNMFVGLNSECYATVQPNAVQYNSLVINLIFVKFNNINFWPRLYQRRIDKPHLNGTQSEVIKFYNAI